MNTFFLLLTRRWAFILALLIVFVPSIQFGVDARIGMMLVGVVCGLAGRGWLLLADQFRDAGRNWRRTTGIGLLLFGGFTIMVMITLFVLDQPLNIEPV